MASATGAIPARVGYARGRDGFDFDWRLTMLRLFLHWILNAVALLVVAHFVEGFNISNFISALIAVIVIGLFNATLGLLLKVITLPLGILTFGIFFLVVNAVVLWFSSKFVPGFSVTTFKAAFLGALALAVLHLLFGFLGGPERPNREFRQTN
jgi:putative membrane protein